MYSWKNIAKKNQIAINGQNGIWVSSSLFFLFLIFWYNMKNIHIKLQTK